MVLVMVAFSPTVVVPPVAGIAFSLLELFQPLVFMVPPQPRHVALVANVVAVAAMRRAATMRNRVIPALVVSLGKRHRGP